MALEEPPPPGGAPEWVVTYGDMMSLLLTFFIMLVSMSEIKKEDEFQEVVEALRQQFGFQTATLSMLPGPDQPRDSQLAQLATVGRALRFNLLKGGAKERAPLGDFPRVTTIRIGDRTAVGSVVFFPVGGVELTPAAKRDLLTTAQTMRGKPQRIEIRGHTSRAPVDPATGCQDRWELAFARCRQAAEFLVREGGLDPARLRLSAAAGNEPAATTGAEGEGPDRVEVFLLNEVPAPHHSD